MNKTALAFEFDEMPVGEMEKLEDTFVWGVFSMISVYLSLVFDWRSIAVSLLFNHCSLVSVSF